MKCDHCGKRIMVMQTFQAGPGGKTQACKCSGCGRRYTIVSVLRSVEKKRGQGAKAVAKELEALRKRQGSHI